MMTESEFNKLAGATFARIEHAIDASGADIECNLSGPVLELEFANGSKAIINRHALNQEIWLAAKTGGFHYGYQEGNWISHRDDSELFSTLSELIKNEAGETLVF